MLTNAYPELPKLAYRRTSVAMTEVIAYLQQLSRPVEVRRTAYIMFRNESANGQSGINNNYAGIQADSGRWAEHYTSLFAGTVQVRENGTGLTRLFVAFKDWRTCVDMLCDRVEARGLFIGGRTYLITHIDIRDEITLAKAYAQEWVHGSAKYQPNAQELANFASMYAQAAALFRDGSAAAASAPNPVLAAPPRTPAHEYTADELMDAAARGEPMPLPPKPA